MAQLDRGTKIDLLNDLQRLLPLGTVRTTEVLPRFLSPEPDAPDGWHWLPPRLFPEAWHWLEQLGVLNVVRLTYSTKNNSMTVRVYVVTEDDLPCEFRFNRRGKDAFDKLLRDVDTCQHRWCGLERGTTSPKGDLLVSGKNVSLAQIYNTLESPTDDCSHIPLTPQESLIVRSIRANEVPGLVSKLYPYQARSVQAMCLRELHPIQMLDPRLVQIHGATGAQLFVNLDQHIFLRFPVLYESPAGGILGEEMGSGKTCESLALILATLDQLPKNPARSPGSELKLPVREYGLGVRSLRDLAAESVQDHGIPHRWSEPPENCQRLLEKYRPLFTIPAPRLGTRSRRQTIVDDDDGGEMRQNDTKRGTDIWLSHATLIVVPDTLVSQWRHEIAKHVQADLLRVLVIASSSKRTNDSVPSREELSRFDIVLISHSRFSKEEEQIGLKQLCRCSYAGKTRVVQCHCPPPQRYVSPLTSIYWKRLIVDEGHSMSSSHTKAVRFAASLRVERKWVVSGTPSRGLVGASADGQEGTQDERFDLDRLCVTVIEFLGLQALDKNTWRKYISKAFLERLPGSENVVRTLLNSTIVRNRQADIQKDVVLPPLTKKYVFMEATAETALSLNIFNALIAVNAVTSQRIDQDYFFHKSQAAPLQAVVRNMLVSTFHWTGTSIKDVDGALNVAKQALLVHGSTYIDQDRKLLSTSIQVLEVAKGSDQWVQTSEKHEMGYYLDPPLPREARQYYLLSGATKKVVGGTAVIEAQRAVQDALAKEKTDDVSSEEYLTHALTSAGIKNRAREERLKADLLRKLRNHPAQLESLRQSKGQAGGKLATQRNKQITRAADGIVLAGEDISTPSSSQQMSSSEAIEQRRSVKDSNAPNPAEKRELLADATVLSSTRITSTSSAKLNYLLTQLELHSKKEKILVFSDFVDHTYHLAEALDIVGIPYLLYTSSLKPVLKNRYILTFNTTETFRVMIMDLHLAAHGLNLSSASRVYFIQQCWSGAIESQAIKRAHRIGQVKPVKVEVLVLKGSIEEAIQKRRLKMSGKELGDTKTITDDTTLRNAIKSPKFLSLPQSRAKFDVGFALFRADQGAGFDDDGLIAMESEPTERVVGSPDNGRTTSAPSPVASRAASPLTGPNNRKRARFADASASMTTAPTPATPATSATPKDRTDQTLQSSRDIEGKPATRILPNADAPDVEAPAGTKREVDESEFWYTRPRKVLRFSETD